MNPAILRLQLLPEHSQTSILLFTRIPGHGNIVDSDPHPLLLGNDVRDAGVDRPGRLEHHIMVLEEAPQGGGGGSGTKKAAGLRVSRPSGIINEHSV